VRLDGAVEEIVYAGVVTRIVADVGPDVRIAALMLNVEPGGGSFTRGQPVTLAWAGAASRRVDSPVEET
jgi:hypothetical protein